MHNHRFLPLIWHLAFSLILAIPSGCTQPEGPRGEAAPAAGGTHGTAGMVSSAHPLATEAGLEILSSGGNAFDAAVAIAATLNVVEPMMSGMGGYGTILVYESVESRVRFLNSSGRIPSEVDSDVFRAPTPDYEKNRRGPKAVSTPCNARAWKALSSHGKLPWSRLFEPAIRAASQGFDLNSRDAGMISRAFESFPENAQAIYGREGVPMSAGDRLVQQDLASSLRKIADQGAEVLHGGELGESVGTAMRESGGFLTLDDLRDCEAEWWDPSRIDYRGHTVYTASPPSTAFPSLIRLGIMSRFEPGEHNGVEHLHRFAEATKHAFWCRLAHAGDPEVNPPPLDQLLSKEYWQEQADRIDPEKSKPFIPPGSVGEPSQHTTHFVVADSDGNIVSATQTLGNLFGSRIMPAGTGIWLNNSLAYCTFEPKGNPMDAHAGRRKLSGDCPTIIIKDGRPWAALGTPGGHTIGQTVPQMVMNLVDYGMDIRQALSAARVSFIEPDQLAVEDGIDDEVVEQLKALGHKIRTGVRLGNAQGLTIEYDAEGRPVRFLGASDPRGGGLAKGL